MPYVRVFKTLEDAEKANINDSVILDLESYLETLKKKKPVVEETKPKVKKR